MESFLLFSDDEVEDIVFDVPIGYILAVADETVVEAHHLVCLCLTGRAGFEMVFNLLPGGCVEQILEVQLALYEAMMRWAAAGKGGGPE